jgi:hypothetical protein
LLVDLRIHADLLLIASPNFLERTLAKQSTLIGKREQNQGQVEL